MKQDSSGDIKMRMEKILLVGDFSSFRMAMKNHLRSFGFAYIDETANGQEAFEKMAIRKFDIIFCEYDLGTGKSGQHVLEEARYRGHANYSNIFIMVITAETSMEMIMGAAEYSPDDYLVKPFTKEILKKKIIAGLIKKRHIRDIEKAVLEDKYEQAIQSCDDLIAQAARNLPEIMKFKGEILLRKGAYKEAAELYDQAIKLGKYTWAQLGRGRADFLLGKYSQAKEIFEDIIAQNDKIMSSYDQLARTLIKMKKPREAQSVLMKAISISPRALLRQRSLGQIAFSNKDFDTAETSFQTAVEQGKHSCFRSPSDYTNLAKAIVHGTTPERSLNVLDNALKEFPESGNARLQTSIAKSYVHTIMNKPQEARLALTEAEKIAAELTRNLPVELSLELAQAYILTGEEDKGTQIIKQVVSDNHDNEEMLEKVRNVFEETGLTSKGEEIIKTTIEEIIQLNNEGVKLVQDGRIDEAITYFEKAAAKLTENKVINANAAHVIMLNMKEKGKSGQQFYKVKLYLDRVKKIDQNYEDLPKLITLYNELVPKG
jgi:tetratricopeptide (TPR) repeat protein